MRTRVLGLVGGLAVIALAVPVVSGAHTSKTASELLFSTFEDPEFTLANGDDFSDSFSGRVTSKKASCEKGRTVKLFRSPGNPVLVGEDTSDGDGNWVVFSEDPGGGTYFAKVTKKRTGSGNHKHICKPDKSPNLVVDDEVGPTDNDADNYFSDEGGDCDDNDSAINPEATEMRNDIDDDCDGAVDDGIDEDADGFAGSVDCHDSNSFIHPDATETRDGVDQDCDGLADNIDFDNDGFSTGEDCDDFRSDRNPDATETADNGVDDDCDGAGDAGTLDADADGVGGSSDCDDLNANVKPGVAETRNGVDDDCDGTSDDIDSDADGFDTPEDCDDTDSSINPGATETHDGRDEDCDGGSDED